MVAAAPMTTLANAASVGRIAIIDIGSNSIRLVVFDGLRRTPIPVFNEKVLCGLGRSLDVTGRLDQDGVAMAHHNLGRFISLTQTMGVARLDVVATAAVREAADGADFVAEIEHRYGVRIRVLSGRKEARLSALGVLSGNPDADGIMGDLGGGSLELVAIDGGDFGPSATLPLGPLRLMRSAAARARETSRAIDRRIRALDWLATCRQRDFYPVGGAWRTLARIHMAQTGYPLHIIDHYTVVRSDMDSLLSVIMRQSPLLLQPTAGISAQRLGTLPLAARVLRRLLRVARPRRLVFSAQGLREGLLYNRLPEAVQREDPLISACHDLAAGLRRFDVIGEAVMAWTAPLFPGESAAETRLRRAACLLADIGWNEHPDYRAEHAFYKTYRLPAMGIDHPGRAFLALTSAARYGGGVRESVCERARGLLGGEGAERAEILGRALRLGIDLSGGSSGVLSRTVLRLTDHGSAGGGGERGAVTLLLSPDVEAHAGDVVRRRLNALAAALGRRAKLGIADHLAPAGADGADLF